MNSKNKILIGCLAVLLVMSIGYALFSDTITINGTATAKGEFELTTTCSEFNNEGEYGLVTDIQMNCSGDTANVSATLGYPGSEKWFIIKVKNTGTIPAKLKEVVELNSGYFVRKDENSYDQIINVLANADRTNSVYAELFPSYSWVDDYSTVCESPNISCYDILWDHGIFDAVLDPEEIAYFAIWMGWNYNSTTPGEPLIATLNVKMDWEQVTVE